MFLITFQTFLGRVWLYSELRTFTSKYKLELDAASWFTMPYSPMVGRVLCQYHVCYGDTLSAFLAPMLAPNQAAYPVSLAGITDLAVCGADVTYPLNGVHPL